MAVCRTLCDASLSVSSLRISKLDSINEGDRSAITHLLSVDPVQRRIGWELLRRQLRIEAGPGPSIRRRPQPVQVSSKSVFISHVSADKPVARRLARELADSGIAVWLDEWRIKVGDSISKSIDDALSSCQFVVLLMSPESLRSPWVEREWRAAYWREIDSGRLHLIPVMISDCELPPLLRDKKYVQLEPWNHATTQLLEAIVGTTL
jgi:hypothetical protein